jgi:aminoglycoside phosphotransferase family enzyme/predicted kinase
MPERSVLPSAEVPARVAAAETHTAVLVFVGDRVYKAKKPVNLGFLDFTTRAARREACERELRLNRRFAPDAYLGLAWISGLDDGDREPLVVMRRMDERRRLARLVSAHVDIQAPLRDIARILATSHSEARHDGVVAAEGSRDALLGRWEDSFGQVRDLPKHEEVIPDLAEIEALVRRYLAGRRHLFDSRVGQGRIVEGHGDLLAEDVFCLDDGPRVLDCLEFDDKLRYVDGLDDAAFLAMDLEHLGDAASGARFLNQYSEFTDDPAPPSLRHHYIAYRAFVRAKVSLIMALQGTSGAEREAARLAKTALRHLRAAAVTLVVVGGVPGSGKSSLASGLADRLGASLLASDRVRKELAGIAARQPARAEYEQGIYTPEHTRQTYEVLLARARTRLAQGETVVLDASWSTPEGREAAAETARLADADFVALRCDVPTDLALRRVAERLGGISDADAAVAAEMAARTPPWPEATAIDTSGPPLAAIDLAVPVVRPHGTDPRHDYRRSYMEPS